MTLRLILFLFPLAYSPGPGNMFFAALGARFGLRASAPASLGYHLATWIVTAAIGLGMGTALEGSPRASLAVRLAGVAYVLWLAWRIASAGALDHEAQARRAGVVDGAVLLLLNPKAYVIIALMFAQFLSPQAGPRDVLWITSVFTLNNLVAFTLWTVAGDRIAARFRKPAQARVLNRALGAVLAGVAIWMALA